MFAKTRVKFRENVEKAKEMGLKKALLISPIGSVIYYLIMRTLPPVSLGKTTLLIWLSSAVNALILLVVYFIVCFVILIIASIVYLFLYYYGDEKKAEKLATIAVLSSLLGALWCNILLFVLAIVFK